MPPFDLDKSDALWRVLLDHPEGVTAKLVADKLKWRPGNASVRLSRLALYGMLDRVPMPLSGSGRRYRYKVKEQANV